MKFNYVPEKISDYFSDSLIGAARLESRFSRTNMDKFIVSCDTNLETLTIKFSEKSKLQKTFSMKFATTPQLYYLYYENRVFICSFYNNFDEESVTKINEKFLADGYFMRKISNLKTKINIGDEYV